MKKVANCPCRPNVLFFSRPTVLKDGGIIDVKPNEPHYQQMDGFQESAA